MLFEEKPLLHVILDANRGETLEHLLTALAMASYEAATLLEDGPTDGYRPDAMLNPDEAERFVKDDELVMVCAKGRFCLVHVRRVRRHYTQADVSGRIALEVVSYDGDVQQLFDRADRILDWLADGPATETAVVTEPDALFPLDVDFAVHVTRETAAA